MASGRILRAPEAGRCARKELRDYGFVEVPLLVRSEVVGEPAPEVREDDDVLIALESKP